MIGKAAKYNTIPFCSFAAVQSQSLNTFWILLSFMQLYYLCCYFLFDMEVFSHLYIGKQSTSIDYYLYAVFNSSIELMSLYILFSHIICQFLQRTFLFLVALEVCYTSLFAIVIKMRALSVLFFPLCLICI